MKNIDSIHEPLSDKLNRRSNAIFTVRLDKVVTEYVGHSLVDKYFKVTLHIDDFDGLEEMEKNIAYLESLGYKQSIKNRIYG